MPRKEVCRANYNIAKEEMLSTILQDLDVLDEAWQAGEDPSSVLKDLQASAFAYKFELLARYGRWQEAMACLDDCRRHYKSYQLHYSSDLRTSPAQVSTLQLNVSWD